MLKLTIHQFRCWNHLELDVSEKGVTLLKGVSCSGKSTIFQALAWCLYGKVRRVTPNHNPDGQTRVVAQFKNLTVDRRKKPNRLIININQQTYEDQQAQACVNGIFGSHEVWLTSCYITQGERNNFLSLPDSERMALLNQIAFHEEDPAKFLEVIDQRISNYEEFQRSLREQVNYQITRYQIMAQNVSTTWALTEEKNTILHQEITRLTKEVEMLQVNLNARKLSLAMIGKYQQELANLPQVTIPSPSITLQEHSSPRPTGPGPSSYPPPVHSP